jgi:hypothetical protein
MSEPENEFEKASRSGEGNRGLFSEFFGFLKENKKWWLAPILVVLLLFGLLIILASTGAAPFIYTLF